MISNVLCLQCFTQLQYLLLASGISLTKMSETSLIDYLIHPITMTSLSLTDLKNEQCEWTFFCGNLLR